MVTHGIEYITAGATVRGRNGKLKLTTTRSVLLTSDKYIHPFT